MKRKLSYVCMLIALAVFTVSVSKVLNAAQVDSQWSNQFNMYLTPSLPAGLDILVRGSNRYINFNTTHGSSGYGFRDFGGVLQFKNSGGAWTGIGTGSGSGSGGSSLHATTSANTFVYPLDGRFHSAPYYEATSTTATTTISGGFTKTGTGTSTFANGISLSNGCFRANGVCMQPLLATGYGGVVGSSFTGSDALSFISAGTDHSILRRSGTAIGFGAINLASSNAVSGQLVAANGGTGLTGGSAVNDLLYWTGSVWATRATSTLGIDWADIRSIPAGFSDGVDNTGGGSGLATSTAISDTYVIYGTSPGDVGAEAAFTYDDATDKLTVVNASTTWASATRFYGALTGTASLATALGANGSNCSAGSFPLGVDASGAVETCTDAWTEAENTSAAYLNTAAVNSYIHSSTTIPKTYTANTFTGLQTIGNASTTHLSVSGNSYLGTIRSAIYNGSSIADAYIDDTITASNYVLTSAFNSLFDTRLTATSSLPNLSTLSGLVSFGSSSATTTAVGALQIGATAGDNALKIAGARVYPASNSTGGMVNLSNGTTNTGPALVAYTNVTTSAGNLANFRCDNASMAHDCVKIDHDGTGDGLAIAATGAASNALSLSSSGVDHTLNVAYTGSTAQKGGFNISSTNTTGSAFQITGNPTALGVGKITHNAAGDADSSILSLAASDAGYLGQGIFLDMETAGTQKILNLRSDGLERLTLLSDGNLGIGTSSPYARLSVNGQTVASHFTATTSSTSTLPHLTGSFISGYGLSTCDPTTGKLTYANGVFGCGTDANTGGSGGVTASTTATYVVYKQGTTYYAYNASTTAVTSNSDFDVLLQGLVDVLDGGRTGGIIHIKQGDYFVNATTTISGNDSGSYDNGGRVTIQGESTDGTRIIVQGNSTFLDFEDAAIFSVKDLSVYISGAGNAFFSDSNDNNTRAAWQFAFEDIHVAATTTHTGRAFDLGNVFRGRFENIEMFGVHHCMRFRAEGTFNPGDFVLSRAFCEHDSTAGSVSYEFTEDSTGFMNQMQFELVEGIAAGTGATFIKAEDISFTTFYNMNAEQYDVLVDQDAGSGAEYHFNYATHRDGIANLKGCRFAVNASGNTCEFRMLANSANFQVIDDANTWGDNPNVFTGYVASDAGTASASSSGQTMYRDIRGYGTLDTNLAPGGLFGRYSLFGPLYTTGTTTGSNGFNITAGCFSINGTCIGAGLSTAWGSITGTLSNQTDLQTALNLKINNSTTTLPLVATLAGLTSFGTDAATTTAQGNVAADAFGIIGSFYASVTQFVVTVAANFTAGLTVATFLDIPSGTGITIDAEGELGLDTTDDQLILADSGGTARVFATDEFQLLNATFASTSYPFIASTNLQVGSHKDGIEITQIRCNVISGTSYSITLTDGTNATESVSCGTSVTSDTDIATNDTFTADEIMYLDFGTKSGTVDYLHVQVWGRITRE